MPRSPIYHRNSLRVHNCIVTRLGCQEGALHTLKRHCHRNQRDMHDFTEVFVQTMQPGSKRLDVVPKLCDHDDYHWRCPLFTSVGGFGPQ